MILRNVMFTEKPYTVDRSISGLAASKLIIEETILRLILQFLFIGCTVALLSTSAEANSLQQKNSEQEEIVAQLYLDFAWEAVMHQPSWIGLMDQPQKVLERYFDKKLTTLILQDRACAKKEGMCRLNFLPIWNSQDPSAGDLEVQPSEKDEIVLVKFRYPSTNETVTLIYQLTKTSSGWRISNISGIMNDTKWSLLSILNSQK